MLEKLVGFGVFLGFIIMIYSFINTIVVAVKDYLKNYKNSEEE